MQQQNNETALNVHIKVEYNQEYRRFVVETLSFEHLEKTLRTLLNIDPAQAIRILFLDDEKDWVLITSDDELTYAWELSASLLRLSVRPTEKTPIHFTIPTPVTFCTEAPAPRWRGMRGGRGCRGGKGRADPATRVQFFETKLARLTERHTALCSKRATLPEEKARALSWRISHLENKIENIKAKKEALLTEEQPQQEVTEIVKEEPGATIEPVVWGGRGRGGCRRGGRGGGCQRWRDESAEVHPLMADVWERKVELKTARQGGNKDEIQAKWEAVQEARTAWREEKRSQMCARKQAK